MTTHRNIAIVCNPLAGVGRAIILAKKIVYYLTERQIVFSLFKENWPADFSSFTDVWIAGGDGTLNYFINHYPEIKLPLVIFNGGTGNDVHWLLYGNKTFDEQLNIALFAKPRSIDAGRCNDKLFINGLGIGFEGEVARSLTGKKKLPGKTSFLIAVLKKIFSYRSKSYRIECMPYLNGKAYVNSRKLIISICNGRRAGGGFHIAPVAEANDGWLDAVLIDPLAPLQRLRFLPVIEKGKHLDLSFVQLHKVKRIVIESDEAIQSHLDGEYYSSKKLEVEVLPGKFLFRY